jgi:hypothetical protein
MIEESRLSALSDNPSIAVQYRSEIWANMASSDRFGAEVPGQFEFILLMSGGEPYFLCATLVFGPFY